MNGPILIFTFYLKGSVFKGKTLPPEEQILFISSINRSQFTGLHHLRSNRKGGGSIHFICDSYTSILHGPTLGQHFAECSVFNPTFIGFDVTSSYWSVHFFLNFSLVNINRQTSDDSRILRQALESYEVSLVTISQQTSYDSGILCQDDRIS